MSSSTPLILTGSTLHQLRQEVKLNARECFYCNCAVSAKTVTIDHVVPKSKGGQNSYNNVVASCSVCNTRKSSYQSFLTLRWTNPEDSLQITKSDIMSLCCAKEKLDLYQIINSYLILNQPEKAYLVMKYFMDRSEKNSNVNVKFLANLKNYHNLNHKRRKDRVLNRIHSIVDYAEKYLANFEDKMHLFEFKYFIDGEVYTDIPYFSLNLIK